MRLLICLFYYLKVQRVVILYAVEVLQPDGLREVTMRAALDADPPFYHSPLKLLNKYCKFLYSIYFYDTLNKY
jgi:hypothetical protein